MDNIAKSSAEWIPTKEKLPEEFGSYLITFRNIYNDLKVYTAEFYPSHNCSCGYIPAYWTDPSGEYYPLKSVIAWAQIPEPYEEGI